MRLIDADKIVEVAEHAYGEWNKAMGAAEGRQINRCYKMQELCKAVKSVANDCPPLTRKIHSPFCIGKRQDLGMNALCAVRNQRVVDAGWLIGRGIAPIAVHVCMAISR